MAALLALGAPALALDPGRATSQYAVTVWDTRSGLPSDSVHAIIEARDHYLWLGTSAGLVRFDGARFVFFSGGNTPGFGDGGVLALGEAADGSLYLGTTLGTTLRYRDGVFTSLPLPLRASEMTGVRALLAAPDGTLWIGALNWPVCRYADGHVRVVPGLPARSTQAIVMDPARGVWIGGSQRQGLFLYADDAFTRHRVTEDTIQALHVDRGGTLWIGTPHGLGRHAGGQTAWLTTKDGLSHASVTALVEDREGSLWIGTAGGGVDRLRAGRLTRLTTREGLPDDDVRCLAEDHDGGLWVGTARGLAQVTDPPFITYGRLEGIPDAAAQSVADGRDGTVWVGTAAASVVHLGKDRTRLFALPRSPGPDGAVALHCDRRGTVWIGQDTGRLFAIEHGVLRERTPRGLAPAAKVSAIAEDDRGPLFFITGVGLARLEGGRAVPVHPGAPDLRYVTVIREDRSGTLWLGGSRGLARVRSGEHRIFTFGDGPFASRVRGISEDEGGGLWLATASGLARCEGEVVRTITTAQGLPESYLRLVLADGRGHLWIASRTRIFRVEAAEAREVLAGRRSRITPLVFDTSHGLPTTEGVLGSDPGFRAGDGRIWLTTAKGVSVVDPDRFDTGPAAPVVRIEGLTVDGERARLAEYPPGRGEVTIEYTALVYRGRLRFRYRLHGLDQDWVDAGTRRTAYFSNLQPGRYVFTVMAAREAGGFSGPPATLAFRIRPPFHRTGLFYALCAGVVVLLAAGAHRLRLAQIQARLGAVIAERTRIARELHDSLAQSLAGTKLQIEAAMGALTAEPSPVRRHLQLARGMIGSGLGEVRRSIWVLRTQAARGTESLASLLSEHLGQLVVESGVRLTVDVIGEPRALSPEVERNLLRIAHEATTNAVRHAGAEHISATVRFDAEGVRLRVLDDGCGFDPEAMRRKGDHFGLVGMGERVHALGGELRIVSAASAGTEIDCLLPYRPPASSDVLEEVQ